MTKEVRITLSFDDPVDGPPPAANTGEPPRPPAEPRDAAPASAAKRAPEPMPLEQLTEALSRQEPGEVSPAPSAREPLPAAEQVPVPQPLHEILPDSDPSI